MYFYSVLLLNNLDHSRNSFRFVEVDFPKLPVPEVMHCGELPCFLFKLRSCNFHVYPPKVATASWCHIYQQLQSPSGLVSLGL